MPKINQEEYQVLKGLDNKWKWIARDEFESLFAYSKKPPKDNYTRDWGFAGDEWLLIEKKLFQFIQWSDEEPYNIIELIQEYEIENGMRYDFGKIKIVDIDTSKLATHNGFIYVKEREESEVKKDIEWANGEVKKVRDLLNNKRYEEEVDDFTTGVLSGLKKALNILDQLDKPEVLSPEWIDEYKKGMFMDSKGRKKHFVWVDDLQNLLMPKQELPVIPQFVDDYIKWYEKSFIYTFDTDAEYIISLLQVPFDFMGCERVKEWRDKSGNAQKLIDAYRWGYEVEKEHKYYVEINGHYLSQGAKKLFLHEGKPTILKHIFNEQEIKDYDERFWPFRKPVVEFEE